MKKYLPYLLLLACATAQARQSNVYNLITLPRPASDAQHFAPNQQITTRLLPLGQSDDAKYLFYTQICRESMLQSIGDPHGGNFSKPVIYAFQGGHYTIKGRYLGMDDSNSLMTGDYACYLREQGDVVQVSSEVLTRKHGV